MVEALPERVAPIRMHTNEHHVSQTICQMQVVGSTLCKRAERVCNLSKRFMSRGGAAPPLLALAEIASSSSSSARFASNHLYLVNDFVTRVLVYIYSYG